MSMSFAKQNVTLSGSRLSFRVQHNTRPLVPDEYNVFVGKLKIFLLIRGDE